MYVMAVRYAVVLDCWVWDDYGYNRGDVCGT